MGFDTDTGGGGGGANPGLEPLATISATSGSTAAFDGGNIDGTRRTYRIEFEDVVPSGDGDILGVQVSNDGGSTWETGSNYTWSRQRITETGTVNNNGSGASDTEMKIAVNLGNTGNESVSGHINIRQAPLSGAITVIEGRSTSLDKNDVQLGITTDGLYQVAETVDAIRFKLTNNNFASGTFDLFGVRSP